jgi:AmmeMemoRadiSam system protein B
VVLDRLDALDPDGLMAALERDPQHACGGGPIVVAMRVALALGATAGRVLHYADSGDVTGDTEEVVGYVSAAFGRFGAS